MKRAFIPILAVAGAALLLASCDVLLGPNERAKTGRLAINFGTEARAAFTPAQLESLTYKLALTGPGNQKIEASVSSGNPFNQEVALGEWRIDAEAYNPDKVLVGTGSATVTVKAGPNQARVSMQVVSPADPLPGATAVTGVSLNAATLFLDVGETATLIATVAPEDAVNKNVTWTSSDPAIVTVSATGLATAVAAGTATVTATTVDGGKTASCAVTVELAPGSVAVTGVGFGTETLFFVGETVTLTAEVIPANATNKNVTWTSSAPAILTVDATGLATAMAAGTATITVTTVDGGYTASCAVTVEPDPASFTTPAQYREIVLATLNETDSVTITGDDAYKYDDSTKGAFIEGRTVILSPFKIAKYETTYELWYEVYRWATDTARGANTYTFANPGSEGHDGTEGAEPTAAKLEPVTKISWRDAMVWCNAYSEMSGKDPVYYTDIGYSTVLRASTNDDGTETAADLAVMKPGANGYRLPTVAEWEYAARGGGYPPITGSFTDKWAGTNTESELGNYAWYSVNSGSATYAVGGKTANTLGLYDMSGSMFEWCWDWYSSIGTGTVTDPVGPASGTFRMLRGGSWFDNASICAVAYQHQYFPKGLSYAMGFRVVCSVGSAPDPGSVVVTGVSLNRPSLPLLVGETATLTATVAPANATNKSVAWTSSNPAIAAVSATGQVTAMAVGMATITATTADGGFTASCGVAVNPVAVTGVSLNKTTLSLPVDETETLIVTIVPANATNKNVTWSSSDTAIATVYAPGLVKAVAVGSATITVRTADGSKTASCSLTVIPVAVTGVSLNMDTLSLFAGEMETLTATIAPANATNKNVTWDSSAPTIATVSVTGQVTALAAGTATITVTTADGNQTASCTVIANPSLASFATPAQYREMALATTNATDSITISTGRGSKIFGAGRTVILSPFRIAKYKTTYELWYEVYQWATDIIARGAEVYTFANPGMEGFLGPAGAVPTADKLMPVIGINWRDAVIWCNAYSEMSGRDPVYYTDTGYGTVLRVSTNDSGTATVADGAVMKPGANGYRLPTEAQWEYAARGGGVPSSTGSFSYKWAGTDTESELENYSWLDTMSHPVGEKLANTLGLYDMSGNEMEWCWDWFNHSVGTGTETDPLGPTSGTNRSIRNAGFGASASTVYDRNYGKPDVRSGGGLRVVCP